MKTWLVWFGLEDSKDWENKAEIEAENLKEASEKVFSLFKQWLDPSGKQSADELREKFAYNIEIKK